MWLIVWMSCAVLTDVSGSREEVLRDVLQKVLHITPPGLSSAFPRPAVSPRHMLELYQKYTNGLSGSTATTIRNILPQSPPGGEELVVFNVSSVRWREEEEVRLAELQLNRRRLSQRHPLHGRVLAPPLRVRLYRWSPSKLTSLASVPLAPTRRHGWVVVDITAPLKELLLDIRTTHHLLALKFESPTGKMIPTSQFLRGVPNNTPYAFLVISSEDSDENQVTKDGLRPSPRPPMHTHALVQKLQQGKHGSLFREEEDNSLQIIPTFEQHKHSRILVKTHIFNTTKQLVPSPSPKVFNSNGMFTKNEFGSSKPNKSRLLRSIDDNRLMDARDNMGRTQLATSSLLPNALLTTNNLLSKYSSNSEKKIKRNKKHKLMKKKKIKDDYHDTLQNLYKDRAGGCTVRQMTVDFAELGWGEWIISPDKFDANYCTGSCRFPLTKALSPSNHATLQSLVHALGRDPRVPAPACVPQDLSAITLLYFDETLNVVLKNYPGMVVDTCACH